MSTHNIDFLLRQKEMFFNYHEVCTLFASLYLHKFETDNLACLMTSQQFFVWYNFDPCSPDKEGM